MSRRLKIALLQLVSLGRNRDANLQKGDEFCRLAASAGADLALFPEMWSIGYQAFDPERPDDRKAWLSLAVAAEDSFLTHFGDLARMLMLNGAELILTPNACDLDDRKSGVGDVRIAQFRSRAFENLVAVAMANYAAPQCDGRSVAFDPDGTLVVQADSTERIVLAEFDLEWLREYRKREAGRDAPRSPEKYAAITSTEHSRPLGSRPA